MEELSRSNRNKLDAKVTNLIRDIRLDIVRISEGYVNREIGQEATYELLRDSVLKIESAYMDLWDFVMIKNGATEEINARMENMQKCSKKPDNLMPCLRDHCFKTSCIAYSDASGFSGK